MFKRQVECLLKSVNLDADREWRIAHCLIYVTLDYELAKEVSPKLAEALFRVSPAGSKWKQSGREFEPRLELRQANFEGIEFPAQRMEFRPFPDAPAAGAIIPGVDIRKVQAVKLKNSDDLTLAIGIRFRFTLQQQPVISAFLVNHLKQSCWLTFVDQQDRLPLGGPQEEGTFVNERNRKGTGAPARV
jgi:hypothetical protein